MELYYIIVEEKQRVQCTQVPGSRHVRSLISPTRRTASMMLLDRVELEPDSPASPIRLDIARAGCGEAAESQMNLQQSWRAEFVKMCLPVNIGDIWDRHGKVVELVFSVMALVSNQILQERNTETLRVASGKYHWWGREMGCRSVVGGQAI
ncbi:hypothetical protein RRG08_014726 [Elysia crispata]|uniref:Uncharacterized protein n=1 Tax=Elysia crispata TaxID=231223 RepID=A0AAE1ASU9_9GAST|nr:hypothetical protein RRG08_014726 [Elysia crispata]